MLSSFPLSLGSPVGPSMVSVWSLNIVSTHKELQTSYFLASGSCFLDPDHQHQNNTRMLSKLLQGISLSCPHPSGSLGSVLLEPDRRFTPRAGSSSQPITWLASLESQYPLWSPKTKGLPPSPSLMPCQKKKKNSMECLYNLWICGRTAALSSLLCLTLSRSPVCLATSMGGPCITVLLNQALHSIHRMSGRMITESTHGWKRKTLQSSLH